MCGIIASFNTSKNKETVNQFIINQFQDQISRGKEGFGIIRISANKVEIDRATEPTKFLLDLYSKESKMIIAHHRTPTSTKNLISQTHPMYISNKKLSFDYLVVHNGVIYNDDEIKEEHEKIGFKYLTEIKEEEENKWVGSGFKKQNKFNDSEAMATEMILYIEKKIKEIRTKGSQAFIILQIGKKTKKPMQVFFGRKNNPLKIKRTKDLLNLSSEGEGESIKEETLFSFKLSDKKMSLSEMEIKFYKEPEKKKETKKSDMVILFKEQAKELTTENIFELSEDMIEQCEAEIIAIINDYKEEMAQFSATPEIKEVKKAVCEKINDIHEILLAQEKILNNRDIEEDAKDDFIENTNDFRQWRGDYIPQKSFEEIDY